MTERAALEQIWVRYGDRLVIERATVGRFEPVPDSSPGRGGGSPQG